MAGDSLAPAPDYSTDLPDEAEFLMRLNEAVEHWRFRDKYIALYRNTLAGENEVILPSGKSYTTVVRHTFTLRAMHNQHHARFGHLPTWAVIPWGEGEPAEKDSEQVENWLRSFFYENERKGERFWSPAVEDVDQLDEAWVRVDRAPAAFWPSLVPYVDSEEAEDAPAKSKLKRLFESDEEAYEKAKEDYKAKCGTPIRCVHVPLENVYPAPHSTGTAQEVFEIDEVPLREVLESPMFDSEVLDDLKNAVAQARVSLNSTVSLVRYSNQVVSAYWLARAHNRDGTIFFPSARDMPTMDETPAGASLLYSFDHDLGRIPYARLTGRHGGWKNSRNNQLTSVGNALINLQQRYDELTSEMETKIRRNTLSTYVTYVNQELRPVSKTGRRSNPSVVEGGNIEMYLGEKVEVLPEQPEDKNLQFAIFEVKEAMSLLGGSPALYGAPQPGVSNGYQEAQRIAQAKSLEEMVENGLTAGAIEIATLVLTHAIVLKESLPVAYIGTKENSQRRFAKTLWLSPQKLDPLPEMDAAVTMPAPADYPSIARVANDLTTPQGERPALVTLEWAREHILMIDQPQEMERALLLQDMKLGALKSGVVGNMVLNDLNLIIAQQMAPPISPDMVAGSDPAGLLAIQQMNQPGGAATMPMSGGVSPEMVKAMAQGVSGPGRGVGGTPVGSGTPESVVGQGVQQREQLGQPVAP